MFAEFQPIPWNNFLQECYFYLMFVSVLQLALFIIGSIILLVVSALSKKQRPFLGQRVGRFAVFNALLLVVGALFNGVWSCTIWGRFYYSTDYVFDFTPFWPITQRVIDAPFGNERGQLLGITLFELQLIWLAFALGTWTIAIFLYKKLKKWASLPLTTDN